MQVVRSGWFICCDILCGKKADGEGVEYEICMHTGQSYLTSRMAFSLKNGNWLPMGVYVSLRTVHLRKGLSTKMQTCERTHHNVP